MTKPIERRRAAASADAPPRPAPAGARTLPTLARATAEKRKDPETAAVSSQYEKYPLPFFDRERLLTWAVEPTGRYVEDCETGRAFAIEFLKSDDGTFGWATLLSRIVNGMIRAGPGKELWGDGRPKSNGLVIGFMSVLSDVLCAAHFNSKSTWPAFVDAIVAMEGSGR
jgi:hypothetical protein